MTVPTSAQNGSQLAVEIAVQDLDGVRVALDAGANRIELCAALETGGLTPSAAMTERAVTLAAEHGRTDFVHVLIRSRPGDFVYTEDELAVMHRDVEFAAGIGVSGVVLGTLTPQCSVDHDAVRRLCEAAAGAQITFHRAIDVVPDPRDEVQWLAEAGVTRILTSGGAGRVGDGVAGIRDVAAEGLVEVMAGGGLVVADLSAVAQAGAAAVHSSARRTVTGLPVGPGGGAAEWTRTDPDLVGELVAAAAGLNVSRIRGAAAPSH